MKREGVKKGFFLEFTKSRKVVYNFEDRKVSKAHLKAVLEAGRWSPSFQNSQPWKFKIIEDKTLIPQITKLSAYGAFISQPPMLVALIIPNGIIDGDLNGKIKTKLDIHEAHISVGMSCLNMSLEATDLEMASAFISPQDQVGELIKLNKGDRVPIVLALGYEKVTAFKRKRARKKLSELMY